MTNNPTITRDSMSEQEIRGSLQSGTDLLANGNLTF